MSRFRHCLVVALTVVAASAGPATPGGRTRRVFQIDLSTREVLRTQDWSGRASISKGRIASIEKTSGSADTVHADMSWTIVYGRSLKGRPKERPREKALIVTVDSPADAVLSVDTKAGPFSFVVGEVYQGKALDVLDGNAQVSLGAPRRQGRRGRPQLPAAKIAGELPAEVVSDPSRQSEWPALAVSTGGTRWVAYVEWDGRERDRVLVRQRPKEGAWLPAVELDDGGWDHYWPAVVTIGETALVVWSSQAGGNVDLYSATLAPSGRPQRVTRLTDAPHTDFQARMVVHRAGTVTLVWQSFRDGQSDIYARRLRDGQWGEELRVSPSDANDWQPALAADSRDSAWISWDGYENGNHDVFLRRLGPDGLGPVIRVTAEATAQFHSSVAVDRRGRVWVAWDDGGPNWGKDLSASSAAPGNIGLHAARSIGLRVIAGGKVLDPVPHPRSVMTGLMQQYAELPQLATDGNGTLWLVFRHWTVKRPTEMFHVYATRLDADGWRTPWRLARSSGRNTQWAAVAEQPAGGLCVAYASDGRALDNLPKDQAHSLTYAVATADLQQGEGMPQVELMEAVLPEPGERPPRRSRASASVDGRTYTLLMGDCHRHTDIRGHSAVDASVMDTFRYALDPGQLDYMGLGDHNEIFGGKWPDGLRDYQWWWTQKAVDLFHCPPRFVGLYSYEHSMSRPGGHRNMIFLKRGAPLRMVDRGGKDKSNPANMPPELWKWVRKEVLSQPGQKCVIVPHTFAAGPLADWNWPNAEFDCLLEIYQGCRGSYERWGLPPGEKRGGTQTKEPGHFAQDALAKGNVYGFVSFSDHRSTHNSWGCVWTEDISREGLLDAMLAKRTYAASDEITLRVIADGRYMPGEAFDAEVTAPPAFSIEIEAPDDLRRVDIVKNGEYIWSKAPSGRSFRATFKDVNVSPGKAYYYVRVFQRDTEKPDGDPEIAWSSPIFVTYR